jgi:hypothetical protein
VDVDWPAKGVWRNLNEKPTHGGIVINRQKQMSWSRPSVYVLVCIGILACNRSSKDGRAATGPTPAVVSSRSVVFDANQAEAFIPALSACEEIPVDRIEGFWTPSAAEIQELDRRLPGVLRSALNARWQVDAKDYWFQYFGIINSGRQLILVNSIHEVIRRAGSTDVDEWKRKPVVVCDAGFGAFQTVYDPAGAAFTPIRFFSRYGGPAQR